MLRIRRARTSHRPSPRPPNHRRLLRQLQTCPPSLQSAQPLDTHPQRRQRRSTPQLQKQHHRLRFPLPGPLQRRQTRRNQRHTQQPLLHLHERRTRRTTHRNHHRKRPPGRTLQGHHQPRAVGRRIQHRLGTRTSLRSRPAPPSSTWDGDAAHKNGKHGAKPNAPNTTTATATDEASTSSAEKEHS